MEKQDEMFAYSKAVLIQSMSRQVQPDTHYPFPLIDGDVEFVGADGTADVYRCWNVASLVDWASYRHWTEAAQLPFHLIWPELDGDVEFNPVGSYWRFAQVPARGQILFTPNPNVRIVFAPQYRWTHLVWCELGCRHEYENVRTANCYKEDRCVRCGYHWAVDSSD